MACRDALQVETNNMIETLDVTQIAEHPEDDTVFTEKLLFGVESKVPSSDILQNNLTEFEWVVRNKVYPNFWGRYLTGEDALTREEIEFLHGKGCKIAAIYKDAEGGQDEEKGRLQAKKVAIIALELGIPENTAIFLEIGTNSNINMEYLKGYALELLSEGYTPAFKASTDATYVFDAAFSRGFWIFPEVFKQCLIWAETPIVKEYFRITTTHIIHPDEWKPYAPSAISRFNIAIWQYGKECHPIYDDKNKEASFNASLVRNAQVIIDKMF